MIDIGWLAIAALMIDICNSHRGEKDQYYATSDIAHLHMFESMKSNVTAVEHDVDWRFLPKPCHMTKGFTFVGSI